MNDYDFVTFCIYLLNIIQQNITINFTITGWQKRRQKNSKTKQKQTNKHGKKWNTKVQHDFATGYVSLLKWRQNTVLLSASEHQKLKGSKNLSVRSEEELPVEKHLEHLLSFYAPQNFNETTALVYELI